MHAQHGREEGNENKQSLLREPAVSFNLGQLVSGTKKRRKKKKHNLNISMAGVSLRLNFSPSLSLKRLRGKGLAGEEES